MTWMPWSAGANDILEQFDDLTAFDDVLTSPDAATTGGWSVASAAESHAI